MGPVQGHLGMGRIQRFTKNRPCPVCGGHKDLPQGKGRRCYGFMSGDGLYAHCTREEYAGRIERNANSNAYPHRFEGDCRCGKMHGAGPTTVRPCPGPGNGRVAPNVDSYKHRELGKPSQSWPYRYATGELAGYAARWDRSDGVKEFRPLVLEDERLQSKGIPSPRPLYNLLELGERPEAPVLVVEGEKTSDAAGKLFSSHVATTSMSGAKAPHLSDWTPLKSREVVVWPDNDPDGQRYALEVATLVLKAGALTARIVQLANGMPPRWDLADPVPGGVDLEKLLADAEPVDFEREEQDAEEEKAERGHSVSLGDQLLRWACESADLYCDGEDAYADVLINGHRETLTIDSKGFERWLRGLFLDRMERGARREILTHAQENLDALAARALQRRVYQRTATVGNKLYVDLCDTSRRVVEIDAEGWRVLSNPPEVRFRRTKTMGPLPEPVKGDSRTGLSTLRGFLNVDDRDFVLCVAWLLAALRDTGPFPLLVLTGEQGSAKSTAAKLIRSLVDPARPPTTGMPRGERDAAIAAHNRHVLVYDNLSGLPTWFSDTLCRLSTGEGFATRALYTNDEEMVIEASRPVILTGIENPSIRGDLAERSITLRLAPIAEADRRTESDLLTAFENVAPIIFGALLDGLSEGLRKHGEVRLDQMPRMADFCKWAVACEVAYWPPGTFMAAYVEAQASATGDVLEASPVGQKLREWVEVYETFDGTATELLDRLNEYLQHEQRPRAWPANGSLMGKHLTRLAPSLRKLGFTAERRRANRGNLWRLESPTQASGAV